jgi:trehalose 6-phosphate synthase
LGASDFSANDQERENMTTTKSKSNPLIVIISNRGPFSFTQKEDGTFEHTLGAGGLVTALGALAEKHEVMWVAAALSDDDRAWARKQTDWPQVVDGISLRLVIPDPEAFEAYYNVIANPLLWYIQHQMWDTVYNPSVAEETWEAWRTGYVRVNKLFADTVADMLKDIDRQIIVLPQDYHLYLTPRLLREKVNKPIQIQPFVHIPWPSPDAWRILPSQIRDAILTGLLGSDRVGFQSRKDAFNFVQCCRFYLEDAHSKGSREAIHYAGRKIEAKAYPISIDTQQVQAIASETQTELFRSQFLQNSGGRKLIVRADRVEPSKNILRGLEAFRILLEKYPEYIGKIQMLSLLVPSRLGVGQYQTYLKEIMAEVGMINAEYTDGLWEPIRAILGGNYHRAIAAMQLYDVLLVNPIADGMNLVAKEGALVNERNGMIVLSEYAGAYYEMGQHTLNISPFDTYGTAQAMHKALTMAEEKRQLHAVALKKIVQEADVRQWFYHQIRDALPSLKS